MELEALVSYIFISTECLIVSVCNLRTSWYRLRILETQNVLEKQNVLLFH